MQPRKFRILSAITAGSLVLAVAAITTSSGTSHTATRAALSARTESFPPADLDKCPILYAGYPTGGCAAQLQTDLNIVLDLNLTVDGTFGLIHSQTYDAVTEFQQTYHLQQDGKVGPATKNALKAAISRSTVATPTVPTATGPTATPARVYCEGGLSPGYYDSHGLYSLLRGFIWHDGGSTINVQLRYYSNDFNGTSDTSCVWGHYSGDEKARIYLDVSTDGGATWGGPQYSAGPSKSTSSGEENLLLSQRKWARACANYSGKFYCTTWFTPAY